MAEFWRSLSRRLFLGRMLERRRQRDEHRRQLERTYYEVGNAHREAQIWLRSCSPALRFGLINADPDPGEAEE